MNNIISNIKSFIAQPISLNSSLSQLFEARVKLTPQAIAVDFAGEQLTYHELNCYANRLARYLISLKPNSQIIGILLERSPWSFVAILGVLKSGAICLPLNPRDDLENTNCFLQEAGVSFCITQDKFAPAIDNNISTFVIDTQWSNIASFSEENSTECRSTPQDLAYIVYSSKSKDRARSIAVEHGAVINLAKALAKDIYQNYPQQLKIAFHNFSKIDNCFKLIIPLVNGHSIYIIPQEIELDISSAVDFINQNKIDIFDCNLTYLKLLLASPLLEQKSLLKAIAIDDRPIDRDTWTLISQKQKIDFYNLYGAVECTTHVAISKIDTKQITPVIGRSLLNTQIYILDENLQAVPIGVAGELYIGGVQLAREYFNNSELTAEKFIPNPFDADRQSRLYKTGDRGRYLAKGNIEYLGRIAVQG